MAKGGIGMVLAPEYSDNRQKKGKNTIETVMNSIEFPLLDRSYWNWDPKETWAFITWIIFSIYLHTRTNPNFQGANSAIVASIGFLIIWICYFGVNLLGIGLHSYGSFPLTSS